MGNQCIPKLPHVIQRHRIPDTFKEYMKLDMENIVIYKEYIRVCKEDILVLSNITFHLLQDDCISIS